MTTSRFRDEFLSSSREVCATWIRDLVGSHAMSAMMMRRMRASCHDQQCSPGGGTKAVLSVVIVRVAVHDEDEDDARVPRERDCGRLAEEEGGARADAATRAAGGPCRV